VLSMRVDGVLFAPAGDHSTSNLEKLSERHVPIVLLDRQVPGIACDIVQGDSLGGAKRLVDYLAELGHRRIAFINGSTATSTARLRLEGYLESLKSHGIPVTEAYMAEAEYRQTEIEQHIRRIFAGVASVMPTALFAANNFLALAAIRALRKLDLRVPEDVSVVCFDDLEANYVVDPFLTVIAQPAYEFGRQGIELLVERIRYNGAGDEGEPAWKRIVLQPQFIARRSAIAPSR